MTSSNGATSGSRSESSCSHLRLYCGSRADRRSLNRPEEVVGGSRIEVRSAHVSREAVRWDILLARVMDGDRPSLWGPTRFLEPCEEPELRSELARLAGSPVDDLDEHALASTFRRHALELMRFTPPSRSAEPSFFTLEGDPVAFASASWDVHDIAAAAGRARPRVEPRRRAGRGAHRHAATRGRRASMPALSEQRLAHALEIVTADFGELVELRRQDVTSVDEALAARGASRGDSMPLRVDVGELRLIGDLATERTRRWLDEPHQLLAGRTPREAVAGADRAEVVRLLRQIENGAERARRRGEPAADVAQLRVELGLSDELAA